MTTRPVFSQSLTSDVELRAVARVGGKEAGRLRLEKEPQIVGSQEGAALVVAHDTVSRKHIEISRRAGGAWVKDLESKNGTKLNGSRIKEALVPAGASLLLGEVELRIERADQDPKARLGALTSVAPPMIKAIEQLAKVAPTDSTVLLEAETGSGKEVTARAIHEASARKDKKLEVVDCGALPKELAASELFGHVKGAFTGADRPKPGAFERADGGTVFLDEIGELPLELQPLLLRALESRQIRRVGDQAYRSVDVRVIAATNRDLDAEVGAGRFRADLLHRLSVVRVRIPPLRERKEDLPMLVRATLDALGPRAAGFSLSPETLRSLQRHEWPGNVRELKNLVERAVALSGGGKAALAPEELGLQPARGGPMPTDYKAARERALDDFERDFIVHVLRTFDKNVSKAARESGIDRVYLHKLIKKHGIDVGSI